MSIITAMIIMTAVIINMTIKTTYNKYIDYSFKKFEFQI